MEIATGLAILVGILLIVLVLKVVGKAVKFAFTVTAILVIAWCAVIGLRHLDVQNLEEHFKGSNNLFLLQDGGDVVTGFATKTADTIGTAASTEIPDEDYYKIIKIDKSVLPEKTALLIDAVEDADKEALFKEYVDANFMDPADGVSRLIDAEKSGEISVEKDTLAFRHGVREVLSRET